tara:strand:+ start:350 stop:544 length:195 start_codon:yes stop_codon:yes gene_type:complete
MDSPWVTTDQLTKYLKISRSTLDRNLDLFSKGEHYIRIFPKNPKSPYRWHLPKAVKAFKAAQFI